MRAEWKGERNSLSAELIQVLDSRGRTLTPCRRKVAEREVRLNRAKWVGRNTIRLRFDPFAARHIRLKILARDQYRCYWCGGQGDTIDHIIPWSKGGRTNMINCVTACQECNNIRGDMPAEEFARMKGVAPPQFTGNEPVPPVKVRRKVKPEKAPAPPAGTAEPLPAAASGAEARFAQVLRLVRLLEGAGPVSRRQFL